MKKYLPIIAAIAIVVILAILAGTSCGKTETPQQPMTEEIPTSTENLTESMNIYYRSAKGYLVPITRQVAKVENMAQAALDALHDTAANWTDASALGVMPTLPEGAKASVSVTGGIAQVDLTGFVCTDKKSEELALSSMTATLLDMPQVDVVHYTVGGKAAALLPFGTSVADTVTSLALNAENDAVSVSAGEQADQLCLAFLDSDTDLLIPVSRTVAGDQSLTARLQQLCTAPQTDASLVSAIPQGCEILGASMTEDTVIIDLSENFASLSPQEMSAASRALVYTAMQDDTVLDVVIRAGGKAVETDALATLPVSLNMAGERLDPRRTIGNGTGDAIENDVMDAVDDLLDPGVSPNPLQPRQTTPLTMTPSASPAVSPNPSPTSSPNRK